MGRSCGLVFNKLLPIKITKHINLKFNDHSHYKRLFTRPISEQNFEIS